MRTINSHNLPERIIRLLPEKRKPEPGRMSVTSLIDAPRIRTLQIEKWDEIVYDISDMLSTVIGISVHERNERLATDEEETEHKIETAIDGMTLVGKADNYIPDQRLILDTKTKSVRFKWFGTREIEAQLNLYAFQQRERGNPVEKLIADIFYRDWKFWELKLALQKKGMEYKLPLPNVDVGYPKLSYEELVIPLWAPEKQLEYVKDQLEYHSSSPMACSMEDRWHRPPKFAVWKNKNKKASKVCDTKEEAEKYMKEKGGDYIEQREEESVRCSTYCPVRSVCPESSSYLGG